MYTKTEKMLYLFLSLVAICLLSEKSFDYIVNKVFQTLVNKRHNLLNLNVF